MKITHKVPNQAPRVSYTPGMRASMTQAAAAANTSSGSSGSPASAGTAILQKKPAVVSGAAQPTAQVSSLAVTQRPTLRFLHLKVRDQVRRQVFYAMKTQFRTL